MDDRLTPGSPTHLARALADEPFIADMQGFETLNESPDSLEAQILKELAPETLVSLFAVKRNFLTSARTGRS
jgi:hypothetical protein